MSAGGVVVGGGGGDGVGVVGGTVSSLRERRLEQTQAARFLANRRSAGVASGTPSASDYDFFRNFVLTTDWEETILREKLLDAVVKGKDLNARGGISQNTILNEACSSRSLSVVSALLKTKANPHLRSDKKRTALHYAANNGDPRVLELVLRYVDNPTRSLLQRDASGFTPLDFACSVGNGLTAKYLYDRFPRRQLGLTARKDNLHRTLLHLLLTGVPKDTSQEQALVALIAQHMEVRPQDVWARDTNGKTPLQVHAEQYLRKDNLSMFASVLSKLSAIDIDKVLFMAFKDKGGQPKDWIPEKWLVLQRMMTSPRFAKFVPVALRFVSESSIMAKDASGRTVLHWLAIFGFQPSLIEAVAEFKSENDDSPKFEVHTDTGVSMPVLSKAQAWLTYLNNLAWEALLEREDVKKSLEEMKGKTLDVPIATPLCVLDKNKDTPLFVAAKYNNSKAVARLYQVFGDECKTWKDVRGNDALHIAAEHNAGLSVIELRTTCAWDLEVLNDDGFTPYMIALARKHLVSAALLKAYGATCSGLVSKSGIRVEDLESEYNKYASKIEERRERRRAKEAEEMESEDDRDWSSTERHSDDEKPASGSDDDAGSTGSVVKNASDEEVETGEDKTSSDEDESEEAGHRRPGSHLPVFKPSIKHDSEYDEDEERGNSNGHGKALDRKPNGIKPSRLRGGSNISAEDEYANSGSSDEENGEEEGYNSMEEKSSDSESPATSPRSPRVSSPPLVPPIGPISNIGINLHHPQPHTAADAISPRKLYLQLSELVSKLTTSQEELAKANEDLSKSRQLIKELEERDRKREADIELLTSSVAESRNLLLQKDDDLKASQSRESEWSAQLQTKEVELASSREKLTVLQSSTAAESHGLEDLLKMSKQDAESKAMEVEALKEKQKEKEAEMALMLKSRDEAAQQLEMESRTKLALLSGENQVLRDELVNSKAESQKLVDESQALQTSLHRSALQHQRDTEAAVAMKAAERGGGGGGGGEKREILVTWSIAILFVLGMLFLLLTRLDSLQYSSRSYAYLS